VPALWVKLGANDLNCVDVPLNPTQSPTLWVYAGVNVTGGVIVSASLATQCMGPKNLSLMSHLL